MAVKMNSLNIVHFNPDGIRGRQTNILNYIDQENTHVIAVSETHLKPSQHFSFSLGNFMPIRKDRTERRKGGVAFFINNKIEFTVNDWFNKYPNLEALSVKISPSVVTRAPIDLVVYYNPPPNVIDQRLFEIVNRNSNNVVIIGDLNSPHTSFGSRVTTESGIEQENILAQENLTLLNDPDPPTYHHPPPSGNVPKILDLAIVSSNNVVIIGDLNSPHTSFGSRITTESGIEQENILAQENLTLLNDPDSLPIITPPPPPPELFTKS